jgi:glucose/arabinose dehydrogenase
MMGFKVFYRCALLAAAMSLAGCGATARLAVSDGMGLNPVLPEPRRSLLPTINVVTARGWSGDEKPVAAPGLTAIAFARGLDHPRWLYVLPNGDVLVAETNAPPRPEDNKGIKGWFFKRYQKKAGGAVPSANRITLLRLTRLRTSSFVMRGVNGRGFGVP